MLSFEDTEAYTLMRSIGPSLCNGIERQCWSMKVARTDVKFK